MGAASHPAPSSASPPAWLQPILNWWQAPPPSPSPSLPLSSSPPQATYAVTLHQSSETWPKSGDLVECLTLLASNVLGSDFPIWPQGMPEPPPRAIFLKVVPNKVKDEIHASLKDAQALISSWTLRRQARGGGQFDPLINLASVHDKALALAANQSGNNLLSAPVKSFFTMFAAAAARQAFDLLKDDEDDIYFTSGRVATSILSSLKMSPPSISISFLSSLCTTGGYADAPPGCIETKETGEAWCKVLKGVFKELDAIRLGMDVQDVEGFVRALDAITSPPGAQKAIASLLAQEILLFGQPSSSPTTSMSHGLDSSFLSNLMHVSSVVDPMLVFQLRGSVNPNMVKSRGKDALLALKGYPMGNAAQLDVTLQTLQSSQVKARDATHKILERVIKGKVREREREGKE